MTAAVPVYDASGKLVAQVLWVATPEQTQKFGPRMPDSYLPASGEFVFHDPAGGQYMTYKATWPVQSLQMQVAASTAPADTAPPNKPLPTGSAWVFADTGKTYFAGFSRPFFVTKGMIAGALQDQHATLQRIADRSSSPPVDPKRDTSYSDDWDEWMTVRYDGASGWKAVDRKWKWLVKGT
jgi:hypothetical protein